MRTETIKAINMKKDSANITQWKLVNETIYYKELEDKLEDTHAMKESMENLIMVKSNIPDLTNTLLYHISENENLEESISKEIAILQERKARFKKRNENLRESIKMVFDRFDLKKLEAPYGTVTMSIRRDSKLEIIDEGDILFNNPELYIKQEPKLDKTSLKNRLLSGENIEGAKLVDNKVLIIRK